MAELAHFAIGFGLSFIGTIPMGIITLSIVQTTIFKGFRTGLLFSLGASVTEFLYTVIALKFIHLFLAHPFIDEAINWIALVVFFGLAIYYFTSGKSSYQKFKEKTTRSYFYRGIAISSLNMLLIPYWIFWGTWLKGKNLIVLGDYWTLILSVGATLGAFAVFLVYAGLSQLVANKAGSITRFTNITIGVIFLALAIYQFVKMVFQSS